MTRLLQDRKKKVFKRRKRRRISTHNLSTEPFPAVQLDPENGPHTKPRSSFLRSNQPSRSEEFFTLHYKKHQKCGASQGPQMFGDSYLPDVQQLHKIPFGESSLLSNCFDSMLCNLLPPSSCTIPTTIWASPPK